MTLSEKDGQLFYKLWLPLLDYVNEKYAVNKKLKNMAGAKSLDPAEVKQIADKLWSDVSLIDQYLSERGTDIPDDHKQIISSWKQRVQGHFVMERHLKKGSVFISLDDQDVYLVQGIISTWEEMFPFAPMPLVIEATFIPFRDVIISDGLIRPCNLSMGKNMAVQFKNIYMSAKKNKTMMKSGENMVPKNYLPEDGEYGVKSMQNKKWKRFNKLTEKCYDNMIGAEKDGTCWLQTFELLKEIILEERQKNSGFASQLEMVDDITDYQYDVQGWLEDCMDELDMRGEHESLLKMCEDLLELFSWPEYSSSGIKFRKLAALGALGQKEEAIKYCKQWTKKEPENIVAATAGVYAFIETKEFTEAGKLVDRFIFDKTRCSDENDIMFMAASKLYEAAGKRKEKKKIDKALQAYEEYLEKYFGIDWDDEELPFD